MNKIIAIAVLLAVLVGGGLWFLYQNSGSAEKQAIDKQYRQMTQPPELTLKSKSFSGHQWTYVYKSSLDRITTYKLMDAFYKSEGFTTGGQTGEFIFTSGGRPGLQTLNLSTTLEPADSSQPLTDIQVVAQETNE